MPLLGSVSDGDAQRGPTGGAPTRPLAKLALRYIELTIGQRFETFAPVYTRPCPAPVLLVHGDRDTTVPVADAYELHAQAPGRTQLVIVKGADQ